MREKICEYNPILDEFSAKSSSKCKIELCQNFKFWCMNQQSIFIPKSKIDLQNRSLLFVSNLVSRHQNSNSPPSIWSKSKVSAQIEFFLHQNLDFHQVVDFKIAYEFNGRKYADLKLDGKVVNAEMVRLGMASCLPQRKEVQ